VSASLSVPSTPRAPRQDREDLLARIDLAHLADQLLDGAKGKGRARRWRCPAPQHGPQTGQTPPVSLYLRNRTQRWKCHGCGAGGTAVDLVMLTQQRDVGAAFQYLRDRTGGVDQPSRPPSRVPEPTRAPRAIPDPAVVEYVRRAKELLWSSVGGAGRNFLHRRGLGEAVLRANHVGYDPGRALLERARGLPWRGPVVVLPALDEEGRTRYLQVRYLAPVEGRKYDNAVEQLVGPSPRVVFPRIPAETADPGTVLVCEGQLDALSAAQAGYTAAAVLGAGYPDDRVAPRAAGPLRRPAAAAGVR